MRTKRGADRLVKRLAGESITAVAMHGNKSQSQREKALARFERARSTRSSRPTSPPAASTCADITHVINFDAPEDRDGYVHRIGRTGRAGRSGIGITFAGREQVARRREDRRRPRGAGELGPAA